MTSAWLRVGVASRRSLGVWLAAGVYSVESDQSAVAFVLGRAVGRDVLPGIHWNPAWPIGRVVRREDRDQLHDAGRLPHDRAAGRARRSRISG